MLSLSLVAVMMFITCNLKQYRKNVYSQIFMIKNWVRVFNDWLFSIIVAIFRACKLKLKLQQNRLVPNALYFILLTSAIDYKHHRTVYSFQKFESSLVVLKFLHFNNEYVDSLQNFVVKVHYYTATLETVMLCGKMASN